MEILDDSPESENVDTPVKPGTIRIILADSQAIYRVGIRKVFALEDDIRVVAQADSLDNLRAAIERVLAARALTLSDVGHTRIDGCADVARLTSWLERAATAGSEAEVFADQ